MPCFFKFRFFALYSKNDHSLAVKKIIKKNIVGVKKLSSERLLDELKKTFKSKCFIKLCENDFSYEIISTVFPEFKQIELIKNLNDYTKLNLHSLDFAFFLYICCVAILMMSLMYLDDKNLAAFMTFMTKTTP